VEPAVKNHRKGDQLGYNLNRCWVNYWLYSMTKNIALALAIVFLIATGSCASMQNSNGLEVDECNEVVEAEESFIDDLINSQNPYNSVETPINVTLIARIELIECQFALRFLSFPLSPQAPPYFT
jgi:hypothetical protein